MRFLKTGTFTPWLNYVPRKMPDVRSRYALYTNMRRFIYCMLYLMYECPAAFMIRSVSLPLITPFSHNSLTKIRPLPLITVRLLFILYCYNLQTRCISLVLNFRRHCKLMWWWVRLEISWCGAITAHFLPKKYMRRQTLYSMWSFSIYLCSFTWIK